MSTAAKLEPMQPSAFFQRLLGDLMNASTEDYEDALDAVNAYVAAREAINNATDLQRAVTFSIRSKEKERTKLRREIAKLPRHNVRDDGTTIHAEFGDWLSYYDVMAVVK